MGLGTLDKLQAKAELLADESGKLMQRANEIADGASRVMANLTTATDPAAVQAILASTQRATANLDVASRGVISMIGETKSMIGETKGEIARALQSVSGAATSATALLDTKVGGFVDNANSLVTDVRNVVHGNEAVMTAATADIRQAARSFKELSREVREKPSRLLFSGNQPDRKLP
jgi:CheY-specific phosphatase CheX